MNDDTRYRSIAYIAAQAIMFSRNVVFWDEARRTYRAYVRANRSALDPFEATTLIHGDLHFQNVLWDGRNVTALLDLEFARAHVFCRGVDEVLHEAGRTRLGHRGVMGGPRRQIAVLGEFKVHRQRLEFGRRTCQQHREPVRGQRGRGLDRIQWHL